VRRWRETNPEKAKKTITEEKRKYNREKKREWRAKLNEQKKRRIREYDRNRNNPKTKSRKSLFSDTSLAQTSKYTAEANKKATQRAKAKMPKSPSKYARVLKSLIRYASPRKKTAIQGVGIQTKLEKKLPKMLINILRTSAKNRKERNLRRFCGKVVMQQFKNAHEAHISTGVRWHYLQKAGKLPEEDLFLEEKRKMGFSQEIISKVKDFYYKPDVSIMVGGLKAVNKRGESIRYLTK
jgi:hypothetical protein